MKRHPGHALAVTASVLLLLDGGLIVVTTIWVFAVTGFHVSAIAGLMTSSPLPFLLAVIWALGVAGSAVALTAIGVYSFRERWFWRCLVVASLGWLISPPAHTLIGLFALILLLRSREAFPRVLSPAAAGP